MNADDSTQNKVVAPEEDAAPAADTTERPDEEAVGLSADEAIASSEPEVVTALDAAGSEPSDEDDAAWEEEEDDDEDDESAIGDELDGTDDPLAPAFDLDQGDVICKQTAATPERGRWRTRMESPKEFFNTEILYRFDIIEPEDRAALRGSCRVELRGQNGGSWTLKIGDELTIANNGEDEADVVLSMQQQDFMNIVNGLLNPQLALLGQKMKVEGNLRQAIALQSLFAPSQD